ncbi:uncharacterized protein ATNIH1004_001565 [Aspergillus tanneri]|uniref:BZIP domain-containing protein n=1 Tax=Aspergillus tanneri TaxID=1220188 RepID=A0A5M9N4L7_9EURO|nr:uncharacterized protein ATNIH1004_001565 [Aspergillus tanneri]KAA8652660.1 hypothetical protein ATNIH1004_001565 [Aspergillus tanneri]
MEASKAPRTFFGIWSVPLIMGLLDSLRSRSSSRAAKEPLRLRQSLTTTQPIKHSHIRKANTYGNASTEAAHSSQDVTKSNRIGNGSPKSESNRQQRCYSLHAGSPVSKRTANQSQLSSTQPKRSTRGSRRLNGFMTLLHPRRAHTRKGLSGHVDDATSGSSHAHDDCFQSLGTQEDQCPQTRKEIQSSIYLDVNLESRNVSDNTTQSLNSEQTSGTVCRHPSRSTSTPIALVDPDYACQPPFSEDEQTIHEIPSSNPFSDPSNDTAVCSIRQQSSDSTDTGAQFTHTLESIETGGAPLTEHGSSTLLGGPSLRTSSIGSNRLVLLDQYAAATAFNEFGTKLGLSPLMLDKSGHNIDDVGNNAQKSYGTFVGTTSEQKVSKRRNGIFGRMRSSRHLKETTVTAQPRPLRRMKTFAHFSSRTYTMTTLRGKSLDWLAQLGGHSFLSLPAEHFPSILKLPVCFVATATYLKVFGPNVRNLFLDPGDMKIAARTYRYFADQVLSAEKEQDRIEMTLRSSEMPVDLVNIISQEAPSPSSAQVLGVAWVFKALLAGLPGGILGSSQLHRALVDIYYKHTSGSIGRRRSSDGVSAQSSAQATAIGLAVLALTRPMQYNLICAVFGLSVHLLGETRRAVDLEDGGVAGVLTAESLGRVLGPLLSDEEREREPDTFRAIEQEIESQRVAVMLIEVETSSLPRYSSEQTPSSRATKDRGAYSTPSKNKVMKKQPATYARSQALRERNRIAASRCRERKKAQEADLIQRSQELVNRREGFQDKLNGMKDELIKQKNMVFAHINCGESGVQSYVNTMASMLDIGAILSST